MISFHLTKRFISFLLSVVVVLFLCTVAYADDDASSGESMSGASPPASSDSLPDTSPNDESSLSNNENPLSPDSTPPDASSGDDTNRGDSQLVPDASSQVESPSSSGPPASVELLPDDTLAPEPEYTVDSALEFLADNGISLLDASITVSPPDTEEIGNDIEIPNFPGMHRVYMGVTTGASCAQIEVYRILPDLYTRLTVENFAFLPRDCYSVTGTVSVSASSNVTYNSSTGILTCPLVYWSGSLSPSTAARPRFRFDVYCFYNDSIPDTPADVAAETVWTVKGFEQGADMELPNFPGLHRRSLAGNVWSITPLTLSLASDFPDLYSSFNVFNFCISPGYFRYADAYHPFSKPYFSYDVDTGVCTSGTWTGTIFNIDSATKNKYPDHNYYAFLFYNIPEEMEGYEPDPIPPDPPAPDEPGEDDPPAETAPVHSFWSTDFADYTVSEGLLFLVFCLVAIFGVIKIFR